MEPCDDRLLGGELAGVRGGPSRGQRFPKNVLMIEIDHMRLGPDVRSSSDRTACRLRREGLGRAEQKSRIFASEAGHSCLPRCLSWLVVAPVMIHGIASSAAVPAQKRNPVGDAKLRHAGRRIAFGRSGSRRVRSGSAPRTSAAQYPSSCPLSGDRKKPLRGVAIRYRDRAAANLCAIARCCSAFAIHLRRNARRHLLAAWMQGASATKPRQRSPPGAVDKPG